MGQKVLAAVAAVASLAIIVATPSFSLLGR